MTGIRLVDWAMVSVRPIGDLLDSEPDFPAGPLTALLGSWSSSYRLE